ncbi:biotin-dependent carboxyltransferase family protein [Gryllotalpicola reticulitermitis]|uniref:Biotin-dependent carboxyltransferase family protein n=1 Tax=Gryllotalpicola reticulitermitis TaxID=1184153 RepID=A0ABV8Q603_9MICO
MAAVVVERVGWRAVIEDAGRPGFADLGLGAAGFADRGSAKLANRLVGNAAGEALVETLFGGLVLRSVGAVLVAVTGAPCPLALRSGDDTVGGRSGRTRHPAMYEVIQLADGDRLELGSPAAGLRSYVAIHGGIAVEPVLGSRSYDSLADLGPAPLEPGRELPVGEHAEGWPLVDAVAWPDWTMPAGAGAPRTVVLDAIRGPRDDWFEPSSLSRLDGGAFEVTNDVDRVGVRLSSGQPLERRHSRELPSEGVVLGAIQVPADGHPIVFLADHPVTGGYPVIAVLTAASVDRAAQLVPGQRVRIRLRR